MQALVSRRRALKGAACTAALGAVPFSTLRTAVAKAMDDQETVTWSRVPSTAAAVARFVL